MIGVVLRRIGGFLLNVPGMLYGFFFSVSCPCGERRIIFLLF